MPIPLIDPPPLSRPLAADSVAEAGLDVVVTATATERAAIARADGLVDLAALVGTFRVAREGRRGLHVRGLVKAHVTQTCVVSLEAFDGEVEQAVDLHYLPEDDLRALAARVARPESAKGAARKLAKDSAEPEPDPPDTMVNGTIDLGIVTDEALSLALDPYPRKPGVAFTEPAPPSPDDRAASPFAVLGRLRSGPDPEAS